MQVPADDLPDTDSVVPAHDLPDHLAAPQAKPKDDGLPWDVPATGAQMRAAQDADKRLPFSSMEPSEPGLKHLLWGLLAGPAQTAVKISQTALGERPVPHGLEALGEASMAALGGTGGLEPKPTMLSKIGRINASDQAKETIAAGFVLPPAEASEGHIGQINLTNVAAGEAGKIKLGQMAAAKNQPLVNVYARTDLGLPPDAVLSPQTFKAVRAREGQVYREVVDAVPEVDLARDKDFVADANKVGARSEETERLFPSTKEPPGVTELRAEMKANARGSTQAVMDYIADLRSKATANFQANGEGAAMAHRMGAAQREAAHALEDAMERSVQNAPNYYREKLDQALARRAEIDADMRTAQPAAGVSRSPVSPHERLLEDLRNKREAAEADVHLWSGKLSTAYAKDQANQTLLDRFRKARQTMAKSYDVESVTNVSTGDVSARGLGKLLQAGRPLNGNLKLIADSANSFHRAFQNPANFGGVESMSVLDLGTAALTAGELLSRGKVVPAAIAAASPVVRPLTRARVLSPRYQRRMVQSPEATANRIGAPLARASALTAGVNDATPSQTLDQLGGP